MRSEKEKMLTGELYDAADAGLQADMAATHEWLARYNASMALPAPERLALLRERFAEVGEGAHPSTATMVSTSVSASAFS